MGIPSDRITQALKQHGLIDPAIERVTRLGSEAVRLTIGATFDPARMTPQPAPGRTDTLPRPAQVPPVALEADVGADDLTRIPGIGKATAARLADADLLTFDALRAATDETLSHFLTPANLYKARAWLSGNR